MHFPFLQHHHYLLKDVQIWDYEPLYEVFGTHAASPLQDEQRVLQIHILLRITF